MTIGAWLIAACMTQLPVLAADTIQDAAQGDAKALSVRQFLVRDRRSAMALPALPKQAPVRISPYARAIESAAKKGVVELGVEAYSEVLIQCQKAQSVVLTTPMLR